MEAAKGGQLISLKNLQHMIEQGDAPRLTEDDLIMLQEIGLMAAAENAMSNPCLANALGLRYRNGDWAPRDITNAEHWFLYAAERGSEAGAYNYGRLHLEDEAKLPDPETGLYWIGKSAEMGFGKAELFLGRVYVEGRHVQQDRLQALVHFARAMNLGEEVEPELMREATPEALILAIKSGPATCAGDFAELLSEVNEG